MAQKLRITHSAAWFIGAPMPNWKKRLRETWARNPKALPAWLRGGSPDEAWYRVSWQIDRGVDLEAAARPAFMVLDWLARHGQLSRTGIAMLRAARQDKTSELAITRSMVEPKGAGFLDQQWESWWQLHGVNLVMSPECAEAALAGLEECWRLYGVAE